MNDQRNIALSLEADRITDDLIDRFHLKERRHAARLGFAHALRHQLSPSRDDEWSPTVGTNFNVATIDDGEESLRALVRIYHPNHRSEPYRTIETLMNKGLGLLKQQIDSGEISDLRDLIEAEVSQPE